LLGIANKVRFLGTKFTDFGIVEKNLVNVPEKHEASITSLENTKDLCKITLVEVLHALQAQEQQRLLRHDQDHKVEGALANKHQLNRNLPPCKHCGKKDIHYANAGLGEMHNVASEINWARSNNL
jgi:hypothetical protein